MDDRGRGDGADVVAWGAAAAFLGFLIATTVTTTDRAVVAGVAVFGAVAAGAWAIRVLCEALRKAGAGSSPLPRNDDPDVQPEEPHRDVWADPARKERQRQELLEFADSRRSRAPNP